VFCANHEEEASDEEDWEMHTPFVTSVDPNRRC